MNEELVKLVREKGLLVEKEIFDMLGLIGDFNSAKRLLESLERFSGQKIISRAILNKNYAYAQNILNDLPGENKSLVQNVFIKLGLNLEITKESKVISKDELKTNYRIFYADTGNDKKLAVSDFVGHFRSRYQQLQRLLMGRPELTNLVAINKISNNRQNNSIIGIVVEKRLTKNKNLIVKFEDLTGDISVVFKEDKRETFEKALELQLDDVVGVRASGSREMLFGYDILFPDSLIPEKMRFDDEICIAFISDIHCGSNKHLGDQFMRFLDWINSDDETAKKINYIFIVGDNVDGVGIFPGQENLLKLKSMKEQYALLASYLRRIPKRITMFMCPGQHDAVRVAEPQPLIDRNYASELYQIENLVLVTNPTLVKLLNKNKEFKILMYHGASIHTFINEIKELRESKAHKSPARAVRHMLKRRHLAPIHSEAVYIPNMDKDPMVIAEVPDVLCTGEVHRLDIENYNGVLIITGSCWQGQTAFEEKVGNIPDPGKVPVLNLKTRELRVFDFSGEQV